jgi:hypothetical protein
MNSRETFAISQTGNPKTTNNIAGCDKTYRAKCVDNKDPKKSGRIKVWIPELMAGKVDEKEGRWVLPATEYAGCNVEAKNGVDDCGSLLIPPVGSFVWVFFECDDPDKGRYRGGCVIESQIPTEQQAGGQYWNKHTLIKTPTGRQLFVSDDPDDASVLIRGQDRSKGTRTVKSDPRREDSHEIVVWENSSEKYILCKTGAGHYIVLDETQDLVRLQHPCGSFIEMRPNGDIVIQAAHFILMNCESAVNIKRK